MAQYSKAGVSLDRSAHAKKLLASAAKRTHSPEVLRGIGHFGGFYALGDDADSTVLVASTDGVGTKVLLGIQLGRIEGLGQDLVNHSVNDILCCGAQPLFFLDYMAFGRIEPDIVGKLGESLAAGCLENGIALIGGETAEMPGLYDEEHFDLAGTIVGKVRRDSILDGSKVSAGDVVLGLASSGLHTNGYSLVRRIFEEQIEDGSIDSMTLKNGQRLSHALLTPHRSYFPAVYPLIEDGELHAVAHITGGGLVDNTSRVLPDGCKLEIDWDSWPRPELFKLIQARGGVEETEMRQVFNCGIGMVLILPATRAEQVTTHLIDSGEQVYIIGRIS